MLTPLLRRPRRSPKSPGMRIFVVNFWAWTACSKQHFKECQSQLSQKGRKTGLSGCLKWSSWIGLRWVTSFWATNAYACLVSITSFFWSFKASLNDQRYSSVCDTLKIRGWWKLRKFLKVMLIHKRRSEWRWKVSPSKHSEIRKHLAGFCPAAWGPCTNSGYRLICIIDIFDAISHHLQTHPDKDPESLSLRDSQLHCTIWSPSQCQQQVKPLLFWVWSKTSNSALSTESESCGDNTKWDRCYDRMSSSRLWLWQQRISVTIHNAFSSPATFQSISEQWHQHPSFPDSQVLTLNPSFLHWPLRMLWPLSALSLTWIDI